MAQMHLSHSFAAMIKPQSCTRQCAAARPDFRSVRRAVQQAPHNLTVGTASTRAPTLLRAVRADQQTDTVDSAMLQTISQITQKVDEQFSATVASAQEAAKAVDASSDSELRQKVVTAVEKLQKGLLERETEVRSVCEKRVCCKHSPSQVTHACVAVALQLSGTTHAVTPSPLPGAQLITISQHDIALLAGAPAAACLPVWRALAAAGPPRHSQVRTGPQAEWPGPWCLL
jgi:hypothetical protein